MKSPSLAFSSMSSLENDEDEKDTIYGDFKNYTNWKIERSIYREENEKNMKRVKR